MENTKDIQGKSKKKLGIIILVIVIIVAIIGGGVCYFISRKNTPKYFMKETLSDLKSGNLVELASHIEINGKTMTEAQVNGAIDKTPILKNGIAGMKNLSKTLYANLTYKINDVTVDDNGNKAVANVDVTWYTPATLQEVMGYALINAKINPSQPQAENMTNIETTIEKYIKDNPDKIKTQVYKEKMNLTKINNEWYIDIATNVKDNLQTVLSGFASQGLLGNTSNGSNMLNSQAL